MAGVSIRFEFGELETLIYRILESAGDRESDHEKLAEEVWEAMLEDSRNWNYSDLVDFIRKNTSIPRGNL